MRLLSVEETNHVNAGSGICLNLGIAILAGSTGAYLSYVLTEAAMFSLGIGGMLTIVYLISSESENSGMMHLC